jgi:hypothetical protein
MWDDETKEAAKRVGEALMDFDKVLAKQGVEAVGADPNSVDLLMALKASVAIWGKMFVVGNVRAARRVLSGSVPETSYFNKEAAQTVLDHSKTAGVPIHLPQFFPGADDPYSNQPDPMKPTTNETDSQQASRLLEGIFGKDYPGINNN